MRKTENKKIAQYKGGGGSGGGGERPKDCNKNRFPKEKKPHPLIDRRSTRYKIRNNNYGGVMDAGGAGYLLSFIFLFLLFLLFFFL